MNWIVLITALHCTALHCSTHCTALYCTHWTVVHCIVLNGIALLTALLYCVLRYTVQRWIAMLITMTDNYSETKHYQTSQQLCPYRMSEVSSINLYSTIHQNIICNHSTISLTSRTFVSLDIVNFIQFRKQKWKCRPHFHWLGPLGQVRLVVAMSVCMLYVWMYVCCPLPVKFIYHSYLKVLKYDIWLVIDN